MSWPVSGEAASIMVSKLSEVRSGTEKCFAEQTGSFRYFVLVGGRRGQVGAPFAEDRDCGHWPTDQNRSAEQVRQGSWISSAVAQLSSVGRQKNVLGFYGGEDHQNGGADHHEQRVLLF